MGAAVEVVDPVHAERMRRLASANGIRTSKSKLRRDISVGKADAASLLIEPPPYIEKVKILDFLTWLPKVGKTRARIILHNASRLPESTELRKLSPATRERLAAVIRSRQK